MAESKLSNTKIANLVGKAFKDDPQLAGKIANMTGMKNPGTVAGPWGYGYHGSTAKGPESVIKYRTTGER
jgi:hypothetical protein